MLTCLRSGVVGMVGALVAVTSCGDDHPDDYGSDHRAGFVEDCSSDDANAETCGCFYDRLAAEVPFERFERLEEELRNPQSDIPRDLAALAAGCAAEHQPPNGD